MMSPYAFHQFWLNVEDEKVGELLRIFTFLAARGDRGARGADRARSRSCAPARSALADEVTTLVHGAEETEQAKAAAAALFGGGDLHRAQRGDARRRAARGRARVDGAGELPAIVDLLVETGLAKSKGEARRTIGEGGAYLNNDRVEDPERCPAERDLIGGAWLVLRRGKKNFAGVEVRWLRMRPASWQADLEERARAALPAPMWRVRRQGAREGVTAAEAGAGLA